MLVHEYQDGEYLLTDIVELFVLGEVSDPGTEGERAFILPRADVRQLKVRADAESFDHEEGFIEMCLDIWRFASERSEELFRFVSVE